MFRLSYTDLCVLYALYMNDDYIYMIYVFGIVGMLYHQPLLLFH